MISQRQPGLSGGTDGRPRSVAKEENRDGQIPAGREVSADQIPASREASPDKIPASRETSPDKIPAGREQASQ